MESAIETEIIERVADREGVDPFDLEVPLYDVIDPDTFDTLTNSTGNQQSQASPRVEFLYYGYAVTVDEHGTILIDDQPTGVDLAASLEVANGSQEAISADLESRESTMHRVSEILADADRPLIEQVDALLEVGRKTVEADYATLSCVEGDEYTFEAVDVPADIDLQAGETVPLAERPNCQHVVKTEQTLVLKDVEAEAPELVDSTWGISSYIGAPVFAGGEIYGTVCFSGMEARTEEFSEWDRTFVELLSRWVSAELTQRQRRQFLHDAKLRLDTAVADVVTNRG